MTKLSDTQLVILSAAAQREEDHHREDAADRNDGREPGLLGRVWRRVVGEGSRLAVVAARRI